MSKQRHQRFFQVAVLCATAASALGQSTIYVSASATGAGNGSSWIDAFATVLPAMDAAQPGDQIWVAAGQYPTNITLKNGIKLYGGFAGAEPPTYSLDERNFALHETILDGQNAGSTVSVLGSSDSSTIIDGFTITRGLALNGGGLFIGWSSPTVRNNRIVGNSANAGGGIYLDVATPILWNNVVTNNSAGEFGGGMYLSFSAASIANCVIDANGAPKGGGIYLLYSPAQVSNCTIAANAAGSGGAMYVESSSPLITNTIVAFNASGLRVVDVRNPVLKHNCLYGNLEYNYSGIDEPFFLNGNIGLDPHLADVAHGNFHLQPNSPCIDAGDNSLAVAPLDMDGDSRVGQTDIGADEANGGWWPVGPNIAVHVSPDGNDANDGFSWASAKRTVQAGIDRAMIGGEVWVRGGNYLERITLPPYVYVYGGFSGGEFQRDERDPAVYITILDGQQQGSVVTAHAGHRVSAVDGFTVTHGARSDLGGGGVHLYHASPYLTNDVIVGNTTARTGGGAFLFHSASVVTSCAFVQNEAEDGGGIGVFGGMPSISDTLVEENSATRGGGLFLHSSDTTLHASVVSRNTASEGGGVYLNSGSNRLTSCRIAHNRAFVSGGGLRTSGTNIVISGVTVTGNDAPVGGGVHKGGGTLVNSIIAFNSSGVFGGNSLGLSHSCVFGNGTRDYEGVPSQTGINGNISADPKFVLTPHAGIDAAWGTEDDVMGELHVTSGSPCIDTGENARALTTGDLDGNPRIADGDGDFVDITDMGAYEYPHIPGDLDYDGDVDQADFARFADCLFGAGAFNAGCDEVDFLSADFDFDGDVDLADFGQFCVKFPAA